ncbi:MAG: MATE family efflux transporter [Rhodothermaceae bacterium]|nr:MATE family efflux transporter [Rhodothermaceae bacterium]
MKASTEKFRPFSRLVKREAGTTLGLGLPLVAASLLQMSMSFVDTVMAGNLSTLDLAAVAVGSSVLMPVIMFGSGVLMALTAIVAQDYGAGRTNLIGRNVRQALWLCAALAIPGILILRNAQPVLLFMQIGEDTSLLASGYLDAASWGLLPMFFYFAFKQFNEAVSITRPAMYFAFVGLLFNIAGNYVLMYGKLGFPALGAIGTGYATAIVAWVMCLCMLVYTWRKPSFKPYTIFSTIRLPDWHHIREMLKIGLPIGITITMEVTMFAIVSLLMGALGTMAVAAHQIALNFSSITFMIAFGLSSAVTVRVGQTYGRKTIRDARFVGYVGVGLATMIMCTTAVLMFTFPELITSIYTGDAELTEMAVSLLFMAAIFQISDGLQVSGSAALRGLKDTRVPMYVNLLAYWIIGLPTAYMLGYHTALGPRGLWIGLIAGLTVAAILHNVRFYYLTTIKPRRLSPPSW